MIDHGRSGIDKVTSGRASLVGQGVRIALANPVLGVGVGGFKAAYAERTGLPGVIRSRPPRIRLPVTVAAETGLTGLVLSAWLLYAALASTLTGLGRGLHVARRVRGWAYATGDHRAQPLLQRVLRGSPDVGAARVHGPRGERAAATVGRS